MKFAQIIFKSLLYLLYLVAIHELSPLPVVLCPVTVWALLEDGIASPTLIRSCNCLFSSRVVPNTIVTVCGR